MRSYPQVSIIMPAWNAAENIEFAINSVLEQSFTDYELIVIDDASTDETVSLVTAFESFDSRVSLVKLSRNLGPAGARNAGIDRAKGRYIAFLDADDVWSKDKLSIQIGHMQSSGVALSYGAYNVMDRDSSITSIFVPPSEVSYEDLLKTCSIGCLTAAYDTDILGKIYLPDIRKRQDFALWLSILKRVPVATRFSNEPMASYRQGHQSVSSNKLKSAQYQWLIYREVEKLSVLKSVYYFVNYAINGFFKYR